MQVKEAVTVCAQVATDVAQNDGCSLTVVVVVTHRLQVQDEDIKSSFI